MSDFTSEQILAVNNVKFSVDIKVLEGSKKLELISTNEMEYINSVCPGKKPNTNTASTWTIHQQSRPILKSLHSQ